jgi:hypothetical protein
MRRLKWVEEVSTRKRKVKNYAPVVREEIAP